VAALAATRARCGPVYALRLGHAKYLKAISYAKVKTDAVDACLSSLVLVFQSEIPSVPGLSGSGLAEAPMLGFEFFEQPMILEELHHVTTTNGGFPVLESVDGHVSDVSHFTAETSLAGEPVGSYQRQSFRFRFWHVVPMIP
jgi:hypothetical protein